jgi:hypothetical protein
MDVCEATRDGTVSAAIPIDDLSRDVYGLLGVPIDAVDMATVLFQIKLATANELEFLISTANLNFLTTSLSNPDFRESLLSSDLCTADGVAIVWLGRLLGVPLRERISANGSRSAKGFSDWWRRRRSRRCVSKVEFRKHENFMCWDILSRFWLY